MFARWLLLTPPQLLRDQCNTRYLGKAIIDGVCTDGMGVGSQWSVNSKLFLSNFVASDDWLPRKNTTTEAMAAKSDAEMAHNMDMTNNNNNKMYCNLWLYFSEILHVSDSYGRRRSGAFPTDDGMYGAGDQYCRYAETPQWCAQATVPVQQMPHHNRGTLASLKT